MIAIGAGGLDVAVAMGGGPFYLTAPRVINISLTGTLRPWVSAKDVILKVLEILTTKGNVGCVVEYTGPGRDNSLRAGAGHHHQHGRRAGRHHLPLPQRRT